MKNILSINTANTGGGAGKIAYNLCKELHLRGYVSKLLARQIDYSFDELAPALVEMVPGNDILYSAGNFFDEVFSTQYLFYLPTWKIPFMKYSRTADVVHLHNMHGYYFNLLTIPVLMSMKPVVWTFHDMWPFTGKCSHSYECNRFTQSCGKCPVLSEYPKLNHDTTRFHLKLKKFLYSRKNFVIISPSNWLRSHIEKSFLRDIPIEVIPSAIDTNVFYPEGKIQARDKLGIPHSKKVLLFIASWIHSAPSKGLNFFKEVLDSLIANDKDVYALIVGNLEGKSVLGTRYVGKETGYIADPAIMRYCYSAADLFITPTLAENSSCTIIEAMACGTLPVAFASGGVPEQIIHGETGILIPPENTKALIVAVSSLLNDHGNRLRMAHNAVHRTRTLYSMDNFVKCHIDVYKNAIKQKST